ncbi:MAG: D-glycero-beta-D-manno-heptose-7-phosphate kinase [Bacteroidetes bacterium]|nr:MAG: D-glycero-beta-D-manno-heptose-7-phosphate kinase [Bacteroidota bacterium]
MIDAYMWGSVDRISPEAPVPIASITNREKRLGGAANVGLNVRALGAEAILCAVIGDDDNGNVFKQLLKKRNLTSKGILVDKNRDTTIKTRIICDNQHLLRVDEEICEPLTSNLENKFIEHLSNLISTDKIDAIIFEDYDKGNITPKIIEHIVAIANNKNIPTLVDPKKRNFNFYKNVSLFKPNFKEITEGLKIDIDKNNIQSIHKAAQKLQTKMNIKTVLITLSELGVFICENGSYFNAPAQVRTIADVSGAGDTVVSVASLCLASKFDAKHIAQFSNIAGGLVCEKVGVVPIDKEQLLNECLKLF